MAVKTKQELLDEIAANIEDNNSEAISPEDLRTRLLDMVDTFADAVETAGGTVA